MSVTVTIDGRTIDVPAAVSALEAARRAGISIPALCYHPALPPDGSCRICLVEVGGRPGLHPSCVLPVSDSLEVQTETAAVQAERPNVLQLLFVHYEEVGQCPASSLQYFLMK